MCACIAASTCPAQAQFMHHIHHEDAFVTERIADREAVAILREVL